MGTTETKASEEIPKETSGKVEPFPQMEKIHREQGRIFPGVAVLPKCLQGTHPGKNTDEDLENNKPRDGLIRMFSDFSRILSVFR